MSKDKIKSCCLELMSFIADLQDKHELDIHDTTLILARTYVASMFTIYKCDKNHIMKGTELVIDDVMKAAQKLSRAKNDKG